MGWSQPFVMGRKNFLLANTPRGGRDREILYRQVEIAKAAGINPYRYLVGVLAAAPMLDLADERKRNSCGPDA
ncbi:MAG: IS66 family transposase, partial [Clostridia bacterium]